MSFHNINIFLHINRITQFKLAISGRIYKEVFNKSDNNRTLGCYWFFPHRQIPINIQGNRIQFKVSVSSEEQ